MNTIELGDRVQLAGNANYKGRVVCRQGAEVIVEYDGGAFTNWMSMEKLVKIQPINAGEVRK